MEKTTTRKTKQKGELKQVELGDVYNVGVVLRSERYRLGLTLDDVAYKIGSTKNTVSQLELGAIQKPSFADYVAIGEVYGFSPNDMAVFARLYKTQEGEDFRLKEISRLVGLMSETNRNRYLDIMLQLAEASVKEPVK